MSTDSSRSYLDHAATTPVRREVIEAMVDQLATVGNASSLHGSGRAARRVVEESRERLAAAVGARPTEVVFTSGGTEANNLAVKGFAWAGAQATPPRGRVITSAIEHHAVLDPVIWLEQQGTDVTYVDVDATGTLDLEAWRTALADEPHRVSLASIMWANNEVGTLQPVDEVVASAHEHGIRVHADAVQALGQVPVDFAASGLDALTVTGHKIGGPVGVGALVVRREASPVPLAHGGGQERDLRSGTLDVASVRGFALAAELAAAERVDHHRHLSRLADRLVRGVLSVVPDATLNGPQEASARLPGTCHFSFPGCQGDSLLMLLDAAGVECSTGSACSAGVPQASHVLLAMGRDEAAAQSSLRFSLGRTSTEVDVDRLIAALGPVVERARAAGASSGQRSRLGSDA